MAAIERRGELRRLATLDPCDADAYERCVAGVARAIESALGPEVIANRVRRADPATSTIRLEPWRSARAGFRRRLRALTLGARVAVLADVRACYPSIQPGVVQAALRSIGIRRIEARTVTRVLERVSTDGGLPIGPDASAVLANAVLRHVDAAVRRIGARHVRWVDDLVVVPGPGGGPPIVPVIRFALAELGLELNERKTRVVLDPETLAAAVPDLVSADGRPTATLRRDAHPVPRNDGPHVVASAVGGVGPRRRTPRRARGNG